MPMNETITQPLPRLPRIEQIEGGLRVNAPAKINLNLLVGKLRPDGFHSVDSYVAAVTLYDQVDLKPREDGQFNCHCIGADCGCEQENLAMRAAKLLAQNVSHHHAALPHGPAASPHFASGVDIYLKKNIPPGKGLGGGSSDAAAVLEGLNHLWCLHLDHRRLTELAIKLGSDVPLFLGPSASRMTGRGEILEHAQVSPFCAILFLSQYFCGTADVYRKFDEFAHTAAQQIHVNLISQRPPSQWRLDMVNQLQEASFAVCPALGSLWREISEAAKIPIHMSGSGSALFALCDSPEDSAKVIASLPPHLQKICVCVQNI